MIRLKKKRYRHEPDGEFSPGKQRLCRIKTGIKSGQNNLHPGDFYAESKFKSETNFK